MPNHNQATDTVTIHTTLGYKSTPSTEQELITVTACILDGLSVLHSCGLVHRDVRCVQAAAPGPWPRTLPVLLCRCRCCQLPTPNPQPMSLACCRWENVVCVSEGAWVLIDLETVWKAGEVRAVNHL